MRSYDDQSSWWLLSGLPGRQCASLTSSSGLAVLLVSVAVSLSAQKPQSDVVRATGGDVTIRPIAHASLAILSQTDVVLVDPARFGPGLPSAPPPTAQEIAQFKNARSVTSDDGEPAPETLVSAFFVRPGQLARFDVAKAPTLILITDLHTDHLDPRALAELKTSTTTLIVPTAARQRLLDVKGAETMSNGERRTVGDITVEAVPMYNVQPDPKTGTVWHAKGRGNGYILTIRGTRFYIAGDTSCTPEMKALTGIDAAFLPMNMPYTMTPAEAAECARAFSPGIVYPYHYYEADPKIFEAALKGTAIEVRLRDWYVSRQAGQQ